MNKREVGTKFEKLAAAYLIEQGYRILETNFRCRQGEIDIIARQGRYLVFVEVKYRSSGISGSSFAAVDARKQRVISRVALYYMMKHRIPMDTPCRFDVAGLENGRIRVLKDAFSYRR